MANKFLQGDGVIKTSELETVVDKMRQEIESKYLPMFKQLTDDTRDTKFDHTRTGMICKNLIRDINPAWKVNPIELSYNAILRIQANLVWIDKFIKTIKTKEMLKDALDYRTTGVIRLIGIFDQYLQVGRGLALTLIDEQTKLISGEKSEYFRIFIKDVSVLNSYLLVTKMLLVNRSDLEDVVYELPQIIVNDENADALKSGLLGGVISSDVITTILSIPLKITYMLNQALNELRVRELEAEEEELELLEHKRQEHIKAKQGQDDARLDKLIKRYEDEIEAARYRIEKMRKRLRG